MRTMLAAWVAVGLVGAVVAPAFAGDDFTATIVHGEGTATFRVEGKAPHLPSGTTLHVSLVIHGVHPSIEATFFRVSVQNGVYSGIEEWKDRSFPADVYTTNVALHMDSQSPPVKAKLQQEFGYTGDHIERIATTDTSVGTPEEQATQLRETLILLRDNSDRVEVLRNRLATHPMPDPAFATFAEAYSAELSAAVEPFDRKFRSSIVWRQSAMFEQIMGDYLELGRLLDQVGQGIGVATRRLSQMQGRQQRLRADIVARLPQDQQQPPGRPQQPPGRPGRR